MCIIDENAINPLQYDEMLFNEEKLIENNFR